MCRTIYEGMAAAFVDDMKETYLGRVEEILPSIRYCAYNIGDESAVNDLMQMRLKNAAGGDVFISGLDVSSGRMVCVAVLLTLTFYDLLRRRCWRRRARNSRSRSRK